MAINGMLIIVALLLIYCFSKSTKRGEQINE